MQWFSTLITHPNHLGDLLKNRLFSSTLWFLLKQIRPRTRGLASLTSSHGMLSLRIWRPHLADHYLHGLSTSAFLEIEMPLLGFFLLMVLIYSNFWCREKLGSLNLLSVSSVHSSLETIDIWSQNKIFSSCVQDCLGPTHWIRAPEKADWCVPWQR